jgi:hypothetical protein
VTAALEPAPGSGVTDDTTADVAASTGDATRGAPTPQAAVTAATTTNDGARSRTPTPDLIALCERIARDGTHPQMPLRAVDDGGCCPWLDRAEQSDQPVAVEQVGWRDSFAVT